MDSSKGQVKTLLKWAGEKYAKGHIWSVNEHHIIIIYTKEKWHKTEKKIRLILLLKDEVHPRKKLKAYLIKKERLK